MMISQPFRCCLVSVSTPPRLSPSVLAGDHVLCEGARMGPSHHSTVVLQHRLACRLLPITKPASLRTPASLSSERAQRRSSGTVGIPASQGSRAPHCRLPSSALTRSCAREAYFPAGACLRVCLHEQHASSVAFHWGSQNSQA